MASTVEQDRTEQQDSCLSRAGRRIRRALSRICRCCVPSNRGCRNAQPLMHHCPTNRRCQQFPIGDVSEMPAQRMPPIPPLPFVVGGSSAHSVENESKSSVNPELFEYDDIECMQKETHSWSSYSYDTCMIESESKSESVYEFFSRFTDPDIFDPRQKSSDDDDQSPPLLHGFFSKRSLRSRSDRPPVKFNTEATGYSDVLVEPDAAVRAVICPITNTLPPLSQTQTCSSSSPDWSQGAPRSSLRSHSSPSLCHMTSAEKKTLARARSLPDLLLKTSCEQFTPDISADGDDETYRFQCSSPGLYQCSVTGLVFHMKREGDVVYRSVTWNRKLLSQHHKQPAGPLFDIKCEQQSVCQLHLPHCEIPSTGGDHSLSVAHVNDEGMEFIVPHKITESHVIINVSGFSGFGNVKDEDSPADLVRALVLLFYQPPVDPDLSSLLNVLMLPRNVVLQDVLRTRKKLVGDECYMETSPHCRLHPQQEYTLSTCPEDDSVLVEPTTAEFDSDNFDNYFPSFQVRLEQTMKHIKLFLKHNDSSLSVWERRVCLQSSGVQRSCGQSAQNLPSCQKLFEIRCGFIEGVSGPVLKSLLDRLFEKMVVTDSERESAEAIRDKRDKARLVIDTVRNKGEAASSEMIEALCDIDPFLCEHLGLM